MRKILFYILLVIFIFISSSQAATYNYYFSDDATGNAQGSDGNNCTSTGTACQTISKMNSLIDAANSDDIVNIFLDKSDTWTMNTDADATTIIYGLDIGSSDPIVNVDAYGAGAKPIFDGTVTDFSAVLKHGTGSSGGPYEWNNVISIKRDDCSIKNIKINGVYGNAIAAGNDTYDADGLTVEACDITNFGYAAVTTGDEALKNATYTKNLVHTGQQLTRFSKDASVAGNEGWGGALGVGRSWGTRAPSGNTMSYNVVYNIYGEGISGTGVIFEHNIIGNTYSVGIYVAPQNFDAVDTTVRYNLVYGVSTGSYGIKDGIQINDENGSGSNASATVEVYGNVVIYRWMGISFSDNEDWNDPWGEVRFYNNTVIDCEYNFYIADYDNVAIGKGFFYNNASILYDRTAKTHAIDYGDPADLSTYWTIDNNAFWTTGGSPTVDADWQTNYVTADPLLYGEEKGSPVDWDGLTTNTDVDFDDIYPKLTSSLIGTGKTLSSYELTMLTLGTDFNDLPGTTTFETSEQDDLVAYDIGAAIRSLSYNMSPVNGDTDISLTKDLSFTNQTDTTNVDVYFDKNNPPTTKVVSASLVTTYDTGTMDVSGDYYYRVDPLNSLAERETGVVIHFTTAAGPPVTVPAGIGGMLYSDNAGDMKQRANEGKWDIGAYKYVP